MVTIPARPDPLVGWTLGHYQLLERIGAGGMGEVYRARDHHLDREVAIKVLPQEILAVEASRKRFRKEALALSRLEHPNIATIHDFDEQQGIDFLVMEYIPGVTLSEKIARRPLSEKEVVALGVQLAEGLAAAHDRGVIHRDLKPGNVKLTTDGRLKILDFGLAKLRPSMTATATTETLAGGDALAGTLPYMAPEQVLGDDIDARTDIYGAGTLLYEMATGCRPVPDLDQTQTIAAILHKPPQAPGILNPAISPDLERIVTKCLEKDPENRFQSAKELAVDLRRMAAPSNTMRIPVPTHNSFWKWRAVVAAAFAIAALLIAAGLFFRSRQTQALKETDTIVLADFVNTTADPVFDDALKQALTVQLEQSPFLSILPEKKIRDTLRLMAHAPDERLTPELGRDLCQRARAKAVLWGSITPLGTQYVVGLTAADCANGNHLATAQVQASRKEDVLKSLGSAASLLRSKLGESLASVQKFDAPIEEATTSSLEAFNAYSLGRKVLDVQGDAAAIPFYERAIDLDPNFVSAYTVLGAAQWNLGRTNQAVAALERAYQFRERVSERERFHISGLYYKMVTGDVERANQTYRQWAQTYPLDDLPHHLLAVNLMDFGAWDEAIAQYHEVLRLTSEDSWASGDLAVCYLALEQPDAAEAAIKQLVLHTPVNAFLQLSRYDLAFYRGDSAEMQRALALAKGKPDERYLLASHSDTEAFFGRVQKARFWSRQAADSELQSGSPERAALRQVNADLREAEFGNTSSARQTPVSTLDETPGWRFKVLAALALARSGDSAHADRIAREMKSQNPLDTRLNVYWLPVIQAAIYLNERNPTAAISVLERTSAYELGGMTPLMVGTLYPVYLRGEAYLMLHDGKAAAAEFQKYLDHRGIVLNYPLGALAHLQLGRAYVMTGDTTKAKTAYQDFLTLWKDADPDIPILKEAKAEYAKLQ